MNSFDKIDPALIDVPLSVPHDGYPAHLAAEDTADALRDACGDASRDFPQALWIEPSNWADKARDNDLYKTWPLNFIDRFTNQSPSHECVYHSLTRGMESCRNRMRGFIYAEGPKKDHRYGESSQFNSVWLSPLSGYSEAQPRQWGGSNVRGSIELCVRRGLLPDKIQPQEYNFKHTLQGTSGKGCNNQSAGGWIPLSRFPDGWQETAKHFRALEVIFPESWEQAVCLVLHGMCVHVGRNGHAIPWSAYSVAEKAMAYCDSYEVIRFDSLNTVKNAWRGSFAIASVTVPDDWTKPAGP